MRLRDYLDAAVARLTKAGVDSPRLSAAMLAQETLRPAAPGAVQGSARLFCVMEAQRVLTAEEERKLEALTARRAQGCPVAHLTGHREFYGRVFQVTRHTLIPRPETELLVDSALELLPPTPLRFADLGAGTGCIGLTLAAERPGWRGVLLDISADALAVAAANGAQHRLQERVALLRGDMLRPPLHPGSLDLLLSNPPYIAEAERESVMDEVLDWEPHEALFSENNGLRHLEAAIRAAATALRPGGRVLLEHGATQGQAVRELLRKADFANVETRHDLRGLERCATAQKRL